MYFKILRDILILVLLLLGHLTKPNFKGYIKANNSSFDVPYLSVRYKFSENPSFILDKMSIYMDNFKIEDTQMNSLDFWMEKLIMIV